MFSQYLNKTILYLVFFSAFIFADNYTDTGTLSVILKSPGNIYLDSQYLSSESINNLVIKGGEYKLTVFNSKSNKWNERGYQQTVNISPNEHTELIIDETNLFYFNSIPYNSDIIQNKKILGKTPAFISSDDFNLSDKIIFKKPGYINKDVFVSPDQYEYFFSLKPESVKHEINVASNGLDNSQATWFKEGFVVVSVISSWAAFYFKREAESNHNKYQIQADESKMNDYYNKAVRYGKYSDISITISLASLGTYMYFLIFE